MPDILHRVEVKASPNDAYKALTTREGLAGWWTTDTKGTFDEGGVIQFRFGTRGGFDMKVLELAPARSVLWQVTEGPAEWIGTKVSFELTKNGEFTVILFKHMGWKEPVEFMHHCSTKWAIFLLSLKSLVETGRARPIPTTSTSPARGTRFHGQSTESANLLVQLKKIALARSRTPPRSCLTRS